MKLVVDRTEAEIARERAAVARERAEIDVTNAMIDLSANLLRVIRGAGRSHEIGHHCAALLKAMTDFRAATGVWPFPEMERAVRRPDPDFGASEAMYEEQMMFQSIIGGALQMAASEMLGQRPQIAAGETEIFRGIDRLEKIREAHKPKRSPKAVSPAATAAALRMRVKAAANAQKPKAPSRRRP